MLDQPGPKPIVLSLDLSTKTGWAIGSDGSRPIYGVWYLGRMSNLGRCFSCLAGAMQTTIALYGIQEVIFEAPLPQQKRDTQQVARLLIGLAAVAQMVAFEHDDMPCSEEFPNNVRKLVLGRGNASKDNVVAWCRDCGWNPIDDNAADALALLRYKHLLGRMHVMAGAGSV